MKIRCTYLLILLSASIFLHAQTCAEVLDQLIAKLNSTAIQTEYNISVTESDAQSHNYSGMIIMKGKQFNLQMHTIQAFYNGKTLWVHDSDIDEINISNPTDEELQETNPLLLIQSVRQNCRLHFSDSFKDKTLWSVDLYPNNKKSEVLKYTVQFRRADLIPTRIIISEIHNKKTIIILSSQKYGVDTNGRFEIDIKKYPDAIINDLR